MSFARPSWASPLVVAVVWASPAAAADKPAAPPPAAAPAAAPAVADPEALLKAFAAAPGLQARFSEEQRVELLAAPLKSEGVLYYARPGLLARHVTTPAPQVLVVDPKQVRFGDGRKMEAIQLADKPVVRQFVESFLKILQGDSQGLRRIYAVDWHAAPDGVWTLSLKPTQAPMDKVIAKVAVRGKGLVVSELRVVEVGGDETITTFRDVDPARIFTDAERKRWFLQP